MWHKLIIVGAEWTSARKIISNSRRKCADGIGCRLKGGQIITGKLEAGHKLKSGSSNGMHTLQGKRTQRRNQVNESSCKIDGLNVSQTKHGHGMIVQANDRIFRSREFIPEDPFIARTNGISIGHSITAVQKLDGVERHILARAIFQREKRFVTGKVGRRHEKPQIFVMILGRALVNASSGRQRQYLRQVRGPFVRGHAIVWIKLSDLGVDEMLDELPCLKHIRTALNVWQKVRINDWDNKIWSHRVNDAMQKFFTKP